MGLCIDGEIIDASRREFEAVNNAFNFVIPKAKKINDFNKSDEKALG